MLEIVDHQEVVEQVLMQQVVTFEKKESNRGRAVRMAEERR